MEWIDKESFAQKMDKLKIVYFTYLNDWRRELESFLEKAGSWTLEDTTQLQMLVHKLTGTGSTYGFANITDASRSLEYKLAYANVEFKSGTGNPNKNAFLLTELRSLIQICQDVCRTNNVTPEDKDVFLNKSTAVDAKFDEAYHRTKTILLVDDQEIIRQTLRKALEAIGFNVLSANDGDDALLLLQDKIPDLLILDRMMPRLDGLTVLKTIRKVERLKEIPVIFLTALYSPSDILEAEKLGAVDYVSKPFDTNEFIMRCIQILKPTSKV